MVAHTYFLAQETLRANGFHPNKIPFIFKENHGTVTDLLKKVNETIPLTFIHTPE
jgi:hypothetical protein